MKLLTKWIQIIINLTPFFMVGTNTPLQTSTNVSANETTPVKEAMNQSNNNPLTFECNDTDTLNNNLVLQEVIYYNDNTSHMIFEEGKYNGPENNDMEVFYKDSSINNEFPLNSNYSVNNNILPIVNTHPDDNTQVTLERIETSSHKNDTLTSQITYESNDIYDKLEHIETSSLSLVSEKPLSPMEMANQNDDLEILSELIVTPADWNITNAIYENIEYSYEYNYLSYDMDNNTKSHLKRFLSTWREVTDAAVNENKTSSWMTKITSLWSELSSTWTYTSLIKVEKEASALWNDILRTFTEHPEVPRWNKTMTELWEYFIRISLLKIKEGQNDADSEMDDIVIVQLRQGAISAKREYVGKDRFFYSFKGIPYAKPPTGHSRLKVRGGFPF